MNVFDGDIGFFDIICNIKDILICCRNEYRNVLMVDGSFRYIGNVVDFLNGVII